MMVVKIAVAAVLVKAYHLLMVGLVVTVTMILDIAEIMVDLVAVDLVDIEAVAVAVTLVGVVALIIMVVVVVPTIMAQTKVTRREQTMGTERS